MDDLHATIRLFNYRCFGDRSPGILEIRPGFTGFVGPNGAGKSTLLRVFRELKLLFVGLGDGNLLRQVAGGDPYGFTHTDVEDQEEIFCDATSGPLVLDISFSGSSDEELSGVRLTCGRDNASVWRGQAFSGPGFAPLEPAEVKQHGLTRRLPSSERQGLNTTKALRFAALVSQSMYVPPFRHALTGAGGTSVGDLFNGAEFLNMWANHQGGGSKKQKKLIGRVIDDVRTLFSYQTLHVQPAVGNTTLQLWVNGKDYRLREMGAGLVQLLLVLGNAAFKTPSIIFIDEPELNLHPTLQQEFLTALGSYSTYGICFATHSLGLARSSADFLYSVQKTEGTSTVSPWETLSSPGEFLGELSYSAYREAGHQRLLGVEGIQDVRPLQQILRLLRLEHSTLVIPLAGDQIASEASIETVSELKRLAHSVFILLDSERTQERGEPKKGRLKFVAECKELGVPVLLTERRAIENYFTDRAVKAAYGRDYAALEPFARLRSVARPWSKRDNWRAAREMTLDEWEGSDVLTFLRSMEKPQDASVVPPRQ